MENIMSHVASGLLHLGWAVTGQQCNDDCVWPTFNGLARLMNGINNKLHRIPWRNDDFSEEDKRIWWESIDNPHLLRRITGWIYWHLHNAARNLDTRYAGKLL